MDHDFLFRFRFGVTAIVVAAALSLAASVSAAQSPARAAKTDARWLPWLGCWSAQSVRDASESSATCVVPIAGSSAVDALTIARGKVVTRDRLDASAGAHPVSGQGCSGSEIVNWSATGRRVFLRANYSCGGVKGASSTIFAMSPAGDWLHIQAVRSGGGSVAAVERRHPIELLSEVPTDAARLIAAQTLAVATARAASAAPITSAEIIDAVHDVDASAVRSWVLGSEQVFDVDGGELTALARADVPQSVLQAIMASTSRSRLGAASDSAHDVDAYLSRPGFNPAATAGGGGGGGTTYYPMTTMYVCPPAGCYQSGNGYSPYNGYSTPAPYYPYPGYVPYPLYYPTGFVNVYRGRGTFREPSREGPARESPTHQVPRGPIHEPPPPHSPTLPGPTGKRP